MENKEKTINLIESLKIGIKEIIDRINGKKEETDLDEVTCVSPETIQILKQSLAGIDKNAEEFDKQQANEGIEKKRKVPGRSVSKEIDQMPKYQATERDIKNSDVERD